MVGVLEALWGLVGPGLGKEEGGIFAVGARAGVEVGLNNGAAFAFAGGLGSAELVDEGGAWLYGRA